METEPCANLWRTHSAGDALPVGNQLVSDLHVVIRNLSTTRGLNLLQIDVHAGFEGHRHLPLHHDANTTNIACQISDLADLPAYIRNTSGCARQLRFQSH